VIPGHTALQKVEEMLLDWKVSDENVKGNMPLITKAVKQIHGREAGVDGNAGFSFERNISKGKAKNITTGRI
jgi:hypothetical protein